MLLAIAIDGLKREWRRSLVVAIGLALIISLAPACGSEPEPTPTPVPPTPTATTVPTPTPAAEAAPMGVTGREIMGMLPTEESDCVKEKVGDDLYALMLDTPFTSAMGEGPQAALLTECLSAESLAAIAAAMAAAESGSSP